MCNCKSCGIELNALNMSDIEPEWCNGCIAIKIAMIHPIEEDPEFYEISDEKLNEMSRMLWPFPSTGVNGYRQNRDQFKPNPVDPRADYIRKSLIDYESHETAELIFEHDHEEDDFLYKENLLERNSARVPNFLIILED